MNLPFIIDGHLDLSMNAIEWNRDLRLPIKEIRLREKGMTDKPDRGLNTVSFSEMRSGNIGFCFATLIARYAKPTHPLGGWNSPEQAWSMVQGQLAWYNEMERQKELIQIKDKNQLSKHFESWERVDSYNTIGYLLSLEGADSIISFDHLERLHNDGLRAIGPAHYGPGTYAFGTDSDGGIGKKGRALLKKMEELNIILDVTHLCETSFWEALDNYSGALWASHSNARKLVNHNRQFSDEQFKALFEREAIIGIPLDAWMMVPNWVRGNSTPQNTVVTLETMADHMEYICNLAGNANFIAIGTDLDGGFGKEQCPSDLDTIADLQNLSQILKNRGFNPEEINGILHQNWYNKLMTSL